MKREIRIRCQIISKLGAFRSSEYRGRVAAEWDVPWKDWKSERTSTGETVWARMANSGPHSETGSTGETRGERVAGTRKRDSSEMPSVLLFVLGSCRGSFSKEGTVVAG